MRVTFASSNKVSDRGTNRKFDFHKFEKHQKSKAHQEKQKKKGVLFNSFFFLHTIYFIGKRVLNSMKEMDRGEREGERRRLIRKRGSKIKYFNPLFHTLFLGMKGKTEGEKTSFFSCLPFYFTTHNLTPFY